VLLFRSDFGIGVFGVFAQNPEIAGQRPGRIDRLPVPHASLVFTLPHAQGSLSKVLTLLSFYGINLTKIQSLPVPHRVVEGHVHVKAVFPFASDDRQRLYFREVDSVEG